MRLRSLGYQTDLTLLLASGGRVTDRGDYRVVEMPSNRAFFWGNFLLFEHAPTVADVDAWTAIFAQELGHIDGVDHVAFAWDDPQGQRGASDAFDGFQFDAGIVMTTSTVRRPKRVHETLEVRTLSTDEEWREATEIQIACRAPVFNEAAYRGYKTASMQRYRAMTDRGELHWYGGYEGGVQIVNFGLWRRGPVRRFQTVGTHPDHRRKGAAARLVYEASRLALADGAETLVMVADEFEDARRVYARVGFEVTERQVGLTKIPDAHRQR